MRPSAPATPPPGASQWRVGDLRIDLRYRRVIRPDQDIELPQRMFDLLLVFLSEPETLHTRSALFDRVWPGVIVEDANLSQSVWMLRKALGEERKHWIRTVTKSGYVFEPPTRVEAVECPPVDDRPIDGSPIDGRPADGARLDPGSPAEHLSEAIGSIRIESTRIESAVVESANDEPAVETIPPAQAAAIASRVRRPRMLLAALFAVAMTLTGSASIERRREAPAKIEPPTITVAVLQADDASGDGSLQHASSQPASSQRGSQRWPVDLLDDWLSSKLDLLPDTVRLSREQLIADTPTMPTLLVVLTMETATATPADQIILRASLTTTPPSARGGVAAADPGARAAGAEVIALQGRRDEVPAMVDALSQRIIARLLPHRADATWPALALDANTAERYAQAASAMRRRDWNGAAAAAEAVARSAPDFGMAHLKLAELHARRGRFNDAIAHMAKARRGMTPIPPDAERVLEAFGASTDPRRLRQAIAAYADLARDYPARRDFAFRQAELLTHSGQPRKALDILSSPNLQWEKRPLGVRIRQRIALSKTELAMGYPTRARHSAQQALSLIAQTGDGWEQERGAARLLLAQAHHNTPGRDPSPQLFELAAQSFDASGNHLDALYARFLAERAQAPAGGRMTARANDLLIAARANGFASLEVELMRRAAFDHYNAGRHAEYRDLLQQALQAANTSGDIGLQNLLDLDLLNQDMLIGNYASAETRVARLQSSGLSGERAFWLMQFHSGISMQKGRCREALERLRLGESIANEGGRTPTPEIAAARLGCTRSHILLATGNIAAARRQLDVCRKSELPVLRLDTQLAEASADILEGDHAQARIALEAIAQTLSKEPNGVDRWLMSINTAALLVRLREYDRAAGLFDDTLPMTTMAGYELLTANVETGLAEIAAARGDWPLSRRLADTARRRIAPDDWLVINRLDTLEIADALAAGDRKTATTRLAILRSHAERLRDAVVLAELESLNTGKPLETPEERAEPRIADSKLPGARLDWLGLPGGLPANDAATGGKVVLSHATYERPQDAP